MPPGMPPEEPSATEGAAASESTPLLGSNAPEAGSIGSPVVSATTDGNAAHAENGGLNDDGGDVPKIKVNMATLLPAMAVGIFLVAMDQTLIIATYGKIGSELNALNSASWIATSYFLTLTTFQPLYGKLSDIFGRKECLLFAYFVFGLGCLGCGLSQDIVQLCISRAVAGMGGGGMNAVVAILMTDLVSLRDRGIWQGYLNIVFGAGIAAGAPLGGLMADTIGWRWAFALQFPLAIIAWLAVFYMLKVPKVDHSHWIVKFKRVDFLGAFILTGAVFLLAFGLDNGSNEGWSETATIVSLALTPLTFAIFLLVEIKVASNPFAPGHVILDPPLLAAYGANFFCLAAEMGPLFFIALWYQAAMGLTATQSGFLYMPGTVGSLLGSLAGGLMIRKTGRYYWPTLVGLGLQLLSILPLVLFTGLATRSAIGTVVSMFVFLFGASISITTTLIAIISNAAPEDMAMSIACSYLFRSLGSSIGISISTTVLQQTLRTELTARLKNGDLAREIEERVRHSLDYIRELPPNVSATVRDAYAVATLWAFIPVTLLTILCLISASRIREKKLDR